MQFNSFYGNNMKVIQAEQEKDGGVCVGGGGRGSSRLNNKEGDNREG